MYLYCITACTRVRFSKFVVIRGRGRRRATAAQTKDDSTRVTSPGESERERRQCLIIANKDGVCVERTGGEMPLVTTATSKPTI